MEDGPIPRLLLDCVLGMIRILLLKPRLHEKACRQVMLTKADKERCKVKEAEPKRKRGRVTETRLQTSLIFDESG